MKAGAGNCTRAKYATGAQDSSGTQLFVINSMIILYRKVIYFLLTFNKVFDWWGSMDRETIFSFLYYRVTPVRTVSGHTHVMGVVTVW